MKEFDNRPDNVIPFHQVVAKAAPKPSIDIKGADNGVFEIFLYGSVGGDILAKDVIDRLKEIDGEGRTVRLHLNTPGGDVFEGVAIGNFIAGMKAEVVAIVDGLAASIGSFIAVMADRLIMPENSFLMIHQPWTIACGTASDFRATADVLDKLTERFIAEYTAKRVRVLGTEEGEDIGQLLMEESWLTAEEAVALGLADEISEPVKVAACIQDDFVRRFENIPESIEAMMSSEPRGGECGDTEGVGTETDDASSRQEMEIRAMCREFGETHLAAEFVASGASLEEVQRALWAMRAKKDLEAETDPVKDVSDDDEMLSYQERAEIARQKYMDALVRKH